MQRYDAGPGDWSDRDWEAPDHKLANQAKRRLTLPPWLLLAGAVTISILLCVGLVLGVRALRGRPEGTPTAAMSAAPDLVATFTATAAVIPTAVVTPTATAVLPITVTAAPTAFTQIAPGAQVVVEGTQGQGLNLRASASTSARLVGSAKDGDVLTVVAGPQEADGYTWWSVKTSDGKEGWAAGQFLVLKTQ